MWESIWHTEPTVYCNSALIGKLMALLVAGKQHFNFPIKADTSWSRSSLSSNNAIPDPSFTLLVVMLLSCLDWSLHSLTNNPVPKSLKSKSKGGKTCGKSCIILYHTFVYSTKHRDTSEGMCIMPYSEVLIIECTKKYLTEFTCQFSYICCEWTAQSSCRSSTFISTIIHKLNEFQGSELQLRYVHSQ